MRIDYSPAVELALRKAALLARQAGSGLVRPVDLMGGLLDEEEGHPVIRSQAAGVELRKLRALFPPCATLSDAPVDVPLAPATDTIVVHARGLARLHGAEGSVCSDQLFLAILEIDASARALMEGIGLDFAALRDHITPTGPPIRPEQPLDLAPVAEIVDTARIVDASANRAREALRVLEDFARFFRGDAFLSAQLKNLRHALADALQRISPDLLLQARDTLGDVGTVCSTPQELERASLQAVAEANAKRLQEALRSLEEFGKILDPDFGSAIERLRYVSYTLERALLKTADPCSQLAQAKLYVLVSEAQCRASLVGTVRAALAGGAQIVQLREKGLADRALVTVARDIREMTRSASAMLIINDRPDIALLARADGVHLGQDDLPIQEARRILGPDAIIGVSTHNLDQVRTAVLHGANYIGVGPAFPSQTKAFASFPGLEFVRHVARETTLPAFVLGGVTLANLKEVLTAGGRRVAVSHAICAAEDPQATARQMRKTLDGG